jgi:hypothetical protein
MAIDDTEELGFEIIDGMSGPAGMMVDSLDKLRASVDKMGDHLEQLTAKQKKNTDESKKQKDAMGDLFASFLSADLATKAVGFLGDALKELASLSVDLTKTGAEWALEATTFKQQSIVALEAITGTKEKAEELFELTQRSSMFTGVNSEDALKFTKMLATAHITNAQDVENLQSFVADSVARTNNPAAALKLEKLITNLASGNQVKFGAAEIKTLQMAGFNRNDILNSIGAKLGVKGNEDQVMAQLAAMAKSKSLDGKRVLDAMMDVDEKANGGQLGKAAEASSLTADKLLSKFSEVRKMLFQDMGGEEGWKKMTGSMNNALQSVDPTRSAAGQELKGSLESFGNGIMDALFGDLSGPQGAQKMEEAVHMVSQGLQFLGDVLQPMIKLGKAFFDGLMEGLQEIGNPFGTGGALDPSLIEMLKTGLHGAGLIVAEMVGYFGHLIEDAKMFFSVFASGKTMTQRFAAFEAAKDNLIIDTLPQMDILGKRNNAEMAKMAGFKPGEAGSDEPAPVSSSNPPYGPSSTLASMSKGGGARTVVGPKITINQHVTVSGSGVHDEEKIAQMHKELGQQALTSSMEQFATEQGADMGQSVDPDSGD